MSNVSAIFHARLKIFLPPNVSPRLWKVSRRERASDASEAHALQSMPTLSPMRAKASPHDFLLRGETKSPVPERCPMPPACGASVCPPPPPPPCGASTCPPAPHRRALDARMPARAAHADARRTAFAARADVVAPAAARNAVFAPPAHRPPACARTPVFHPDAVAGDPPTGLA